MISRLIIISGKTSVASFNGAGVSGVHSELLSGGFGGWSPLRKLSDSKEHLDWLKIDLDSAEMITVQDYKHTKKIKWNGSTHIQC